MISGWRSRNLGRVDEAKAAFEAALALRPDNDDTRLRLAFMLYDKGQRDPRCRCWRRCPAATTPHRRCGCCWRERTTTRNDLPASEKAFTKAAALRDDGKVWFNLGVVRVRLHDFTGAQAAFKRAAEHPEVREQANRELEKIREATK